MKLIKQKLDGLYFYETFESVIKHDFTVIEDGLEYSRIIYDSNTKKFHIYTAEGYYKETPIEDIQNLYYIYMSVEKIATSNQMRNHCIDRLKSRSILKCKWLDDDGNLECVKNGIINLKERKLYPHSPKYFFKHQIERNFIEDVDPVIPGRFNEVLKCIPDELDRDNFIKYWLACVHKNHDYEVFLLCYGVKWGGKSSCLNIFSEMYGTQVVSKQPLNKFGNRFGLSSVYDKRVNIHPDMPIARMNPYTISTLKSLTGQDGTIEVELKGKTPFTYPIGIFLAFGINQLMGFTDDAEKEIDSIMRRVVLVEFPNEQKLSPKFKKSLQDPVFLDELYSWFVITQSYPFFEYTKESQREWIKRNKKKWLLNADPILRILMDNYIFEEDMKIQSYDVVGVVKIQLEKDGNFVPKRLKTLITQAFSTMNIYPNNARGANQYYVNVSEMNYLNGQEDEVKRGMDKILTQQQEAK